MAIIENKTPFVYQAYEKWLDQGSEFNVFVLRGTFNLVPDQVMSIAFEQTPINAGDRHSAPLYGDVFYSQLEEEGDLVMAKMFTDISVQGTSYRPVASGSGYQSAHSWQASIQIGDVQQVLQMTGPRAFIKEGQAWRLTEPAPVESVALDYRYAFGGHIPRAVQYQQEDAYIANPQNPIGLGWLPTDEELNPLTQEQQAAVKQWRDQLEQIPAPQIMQMGAPIMTPFDRGGVAGVSPIARWWQPRIDWQGTVDEAWQQTRHPYPPKDLNMRFYQAAHPRLMAPGYLKGDEIVSLQNMGQWETVGYRGRLPGIRCYGIAEPEQGEQRFWPLVLDTVRVDTHNKKAILLWRVTVPKQLVLKRLQLMATVDHARLAQGWSLQ